MHFYGGSPGWDDTGIIPEPGSVVINEVLAHAHADASDWIELCNTTGEAINIGGWFLSDTDSDPSAARDRLDQIRDCRRHSNWCRWIYCIL